MRTAQEMQARASACSRRSRRRTTRQKHRLFEKLRVRARRRRSRARTSRSGASRSSPRPTTCARRRRSRSSTSCSTRARRSTAHDPAAMHEARRRLGESDRLRGDELRRARTAPTRSSSSPTGTSTATRTSSGSRRRFARPVVIDGRNLYDADKMRALGFSYARSAARRATMRVLITGAAGFLGSHLCDRFLADGHDGRRARQLHHREPRQHRAPDRATSASSSSGTTSRPTPTSPGRSTACCTSRRRRARSTISSTRSRRSRSAR